MPEPSTRTIITSLLLTVLSLAGCTQEMANQPRVDPLEGSAFFADGLGARPQIAGTVAQDQWVEEGKVETGKEDDGKPTAKIPLEVTSELLERGQQRFNIFCSHCHGKAGHADGMVVQRGFPKPPSYHIDRLRDAPDGHLFAVITDGFGKMPSLRARITPRDRWAIVSYIRALQLSQHASEKDLPEDERKKLP
jgi:mono/diheme cytochrome c family protein